MKKKTCVNYVQVGVNCTSFLKNNTIYISILFTKMYTLKESVKLYEKVSRRKQTTMTFEDFNAKFGTCLPANATVYAKFIKSLNSAKKSEGIPVTRRLYSIYNGISGEKVQHPVATPKPNQQIAPKTACPSVISNGNVGHTTIRPPLNLESLTIDNPVEKYKELLKSEDSKFHDEKGRMVHLVSADAIPMLGNTCKLNKSNGNALYTGVGTLTMRNQSTIDLENTEINAEDFVKFMTMRKNKEKGPYFLRVK